MLVISLKSINQGFWSHVQCSWWNVTIFSCQIIFKGTLKEMIKKMLLFPFFGSIFTGLEGPVYKLRLLSWRAPFFSPEATLLLILVSTKNIIKTSILNRFSEHAQSICILSQSHLPDLTWSESQTPGVGPAQRSQYLVLTKRSAASWDENATAAGNPTHSVLSDIF